MESRSERAVVVPESMVQRQGDNASVWKLDGSALRKTAVVLGERDARRGDYPVLKGLAEGDRILRRPGGNLVDGQALEFTKPGNPAAAAPAAVPAASAAPTAAKP